MRTADTDQGKGPNALSSASVEVHTFCTPGSCAHRCHLSWSAQSRPGTGVHQTGPLLGCPAQLTFSWQLRRRAEHSLPSVLVVRDHSQGVFGCFASEGWKIAPRYYGNGESFVFQIQVLPSDNRIGHSTLRHIPAGHLHIHPVPCEHIAFGAERGHFAALSHPSHAWPGHPVSH